MADTLVERITGQASAPDVSAEVQIVMPLDTLLDANDHTSAQLDGYGPLQPISSATFWPQAKAGHGGAACTQHQRVGRLPAVIQTAANSTATSGS